MALTRTPEGASSTAMERVRTELEAAGASDYGASFICALCLAWPDGHVELFKGTVDGTLIWPPRGTNGFGYDPMFVPDGYTQTFGEMTPEEKEKLSHRARSMKLLLDACF